MQSQPYRLLDESEYLTLEARSPVRHEYVAGEIFAMTGASVRHNIIAGNLYTALRTHLRGTPCRALMEGVTLHLKEERSYFYPDVMVACESRLLELDTQMQIVDSPTLIIEVLSPSTEGIDRRATPPAVAAFQATPQGAGDEQMQDLTPCTTPPPSSVARVRTTLLAYNPTHGLC